MLGRPMCSSRTKRYRREGGASGPMRGANTVDGPRASLPGFHAPPSGLFCRSPGPTGSTAGTFPPDAGIFCAARRVPSPDAGAFCPAVGSLLSGAGSESAAVGTFCSTAGSFRSAVGAPGPAVGAMSPTAGVFAPATAIRSDGSESRPTGIDAAASARRRQKQESPTLGTNLDHLSTKDDDGTWVPCCRSITRPPRSTARSRLTSGSGWPRPLGSTSCRPPRPGIASTPTSRKRSPTTCIDGTRPMPSSGPNRPCRPGMVSSRVGVSVEPMRNGAASLQRRFSFPSN